MSDIDLAISRSQRLEQHLEREFGASGKGLHQKISSVESNLPPPLVRQLRLVATVRNKVVHENGQIEDRAQFIRAADAAEHELIAIAKSRRRQRRRTGGRLSAGWKRRVITLLLAIIVAIVIWLMWTGGSGGGGGGDL